MKFFFLSIFLLFFLTILLSIGNPKTIFDYSFFVMDIEFFGFAEIITIFILGETS